MKIKTIKFKSIYHKKKKSKPIDYNINVDHDITKVLNK